MADAHIGDLGRAVVKMTDANGNPTDSYDNMSGIQYESSDPSKVTVVDDDAEPRDATLEFLALTEGAPVTITVRFDGDPGNGERAITLQSEPINVVPGEATGGEVQIVFTETPA